MPISSPSPITFDHLLELSHWYNSNKWSNIGYGEEMGITEIELLTLSGALFFRMFSKLGTFLNVSKHVLTFLMTCLISPFFGNKNILMQTDWIQASRPVTRWLAWEPTCCHSANIRTADKISKIKFNWLYFCYSFPKSYVWPIDTIVSMRRF